VGYVLVYDPEAFVVDGEDEGVAELAEGLEGGESVESFIFVGRYFSFVAYGDLSFGEDEAAGRLGDLWCRECERGSVSQ
jgi:hypothetical protein